MKIRKFNCPTCGAAKVNPYKSPYVCCDYCGSLIDIDPHIWLHIQDNNQRQKRLEELHHRIVAKSRKAMETNDSAAYQRYQQEFFNNYYNIFPEFIPPTVHKGEMFKQFLHTKASWETAKKFDKTIPLKKKKTGLDNAIKAYTIKIDPHYDPLLFFLDMMEAADKYIKAELEVRNSKEEFNLLTEIYPPGLEYRFFMSITAQPHLNYLSEAELKHYLKKYGLELEYVETPSQSTVEVNCTFCSHKITTLKNAFRCVCENCYELNLINHHINCSNCGIENNLPEKWSSIINCSGCGTEIRVLSLI